MRDMKNNQPKCPDCGRVYQAGRDRCMWCGADLSAQPTPEMELICPLCGTRLDQRSDGQFMISICGTCSGMWMTDPMLKRFESHYEDIDPTREGAPKPSADTSPSATRLSMEAYRRCPQCAQQMARRSYQRVSGVIVDQCLGHGTWFDPDEFERVIEFLLAGGLARSDASKDAARASARQFGRSLSRLRRGGSRQWGD